MRKSEERNTKNFTETISHEFRTPLATALSFIEILLRMLADSAQFKYLLLVKTSLNLLLTLVNDLLDLN